MTFKKIRAEGGTMIPFGYGIAWRDFADNRQVMYPIPFNIIIRWLRDLHYWLMVVGRPGYREKVERIAYLNGKNSNRIEIQSNYNIGYTNGLNDGFKFGYKDGYNYNYKILSDLLDHRLHE